MQSLIASGRTDAQLDTSVPITGPDGWLFSTYFYLNVGQALQVGDVLMVTADGEVAMPVTYNTEVISQVILAAAWNSNQTQLDAGNYEIGHIVGTDINVNPIHYMVPTRSIIFPVQAAMASPTIQYRIRCRSTAATGNDKAILQPTQGHLAYMLFR